MHPVKVHKNTLRPIYTLGLGLISLFLFFILVATGILLMFYYVPSTTQAYDRMLDLRGTVAFGIFLRNMHRWSAHGMVAMVFLHMCRVFLTGAYKKPREFNWVLGVLLLLVTLFLSFTGYLLPWDQLAFWAITVGSSIAGYAPLIGQQMKFVLLGDTTVGQEALLRFYVLHVAVLPAVLVLLVAIHFWRIRKDGGLSRPESPKAEPRPETVVAKMTLDPVKKRIYGLQGFVRGPFTKVGNVPDDSVYAWPNLLLAELFVFVLTVSLILLVSLAFNAPLEQPVNVMHPPNPAKAPWYFLGLQEMVSYSAFWGGIGIPGTDGRPAAPRPLHRSRHQRRRPLVRQRAAAGQHHLPYAGNSQRDLHHHRHVLPRAELDLRLALLRTDAYATGTGNRKLRGTDRSRRRLLRSVLSPLGAASDCVLRTGAVAIQE